MTSSIYPQFILSFQLVTVDMPKTKPDVTFKVGDLVWVKVKGYREWPAKVESERNASVHENSSTGTSSSLTASMRIWPFTR